ncbi:4-trimethylaminobutyraldehyde dehydrogenase A [Hyalella azteca]|uniref:4-trimethylaminobutyraldehyde dehydrogenase A n=1 Tax=Hyalella azteca TaxID=294128 RepID=A0A8B7N0R0_HYAAZ|nr:4-trimethylaminobutyraldehyde dehydrogenase A [Hyalella azteca]XP_047736068.1 4-trimethylaminobutyraldehyde dehydrogenase A [Hyalella azteca]
MHLEVSLRVLRCLLRAPPTATPSHVTSRSLTTTFTGPWNYVRGQRCNPATVDGRVIKVLEPATGGVLCEVPTSDAAAVDDAVTCAHAALPAWRQLSLRERGRLLMRAAAVIRENLHDIVNLEVRDTGKPIWEARLDIESCADAFEFYGGIAPSVAGQHVPLANGSFALVVREPLGVVAGIGAWNFPMQTAVWKVAPALVCGNTFVYKPSQFTPVTAVTLAEVLRDAGVPDGVYNVVQGEGETGGLLARHPLVAKVSFTGSVPTGVQVMRDAAAGVKAVTLELGGKGPLIVFPDACLVNAVKAALMANFLSQGQVCSNGTRVFVHRSILGEFTDKLVTATRKLKIGNPFDDDTTVGATIHEEHARKVLSYIDSAKREGCRVLCGGERELLTGPLAGGWYLQPTVLADCTDSMKVVQEEVFGSVVALLVFDDEEEVVARANNTDYGLAGAVFTKDLQRGHRVSAALQCGTVWVNTYNLYPTEVPFGGYKHSGVGRECGTAVIDAYTHTKTTYVEMGDVDCGPLYQD